jgi:hypothetical protein
MTLVTEQNKCQSANNLCKEPGCLNPVHARELCNKHLRRLQRTGDTNTVRRPGRPRDKARAQLMAIVGEGLSARSQARYWQAQTTIWDAHIAGIIDKERMLRTAECASRPNGSFNIAELERQAFFVFMLGVLQAPRAGS